MGDWLDFLALYNSRKASELEAKMAANPELAHESPGLPMPHPKTIPAASAIDVVEDQVEAILDHCRGTIAGCGCSMCGQFERIRVIAMEIFEEKRVIGAGA